MEWWMTLGIAGMLLLALFFLRDADLSGIPCH